MSKGTERRRDILTEVAKCVCADRQNTYGDAEDNFQHIAERWAQYLTIRNKNIVNVTAADVAVMMQDLKITRIAANPSHLDNWIDSAGYAVCGAGIIKSFNETEEEI